MTLKNNRAAFPYYVKSHASFQSHGWIEIGAQFGNSQFGSKSVIFLSRVSLKLNGWPKKTTGYLFYTTLSSVHDLEAISEFKLELQSTNPQYVSKSVIFVSCVTLKLDRWPWKTIGHLFYAVSSLVHRFIAISGFKLELQLQSGNAQFRSNQWFFCPAWPWNLTDDIEKNRAPLLCYFKLCASFCSHCWI